MPRRLLFVTDVKLRPLDQGMRVRVSNLLSGCARACSVTLVAPAPDDASDRQELEGICERVVWLGDTVQEHLGLRDWWRAWRAAPGIKRIANMRRYAVFIGVLNHLDLESFDLIWAERVHIARLFDRQRARTIIDLDDLEHRRVLAERSLHRWGKLSWLVPADQYRLLLYRWLELTWSKTFLASVVCSTEDHRYLEAQGARRVVVVPNGINEAASVGATRSSRRSADGPLRLVFLGNVGHRPNLDAIEYFVRDILPLLKRDGREVVFDVVGPCGDTGVMERLGGQAIFRGFAPNLAGTLAAYDLLVAPIRFGSGTRVKLLDAMACRIPIVTTAAGAEGLPLVDGEHVLFAAGPAQFAERVLALKRDPELGARLATNGSTLVEQRFRAVAIQRDLAAWLGDIGTLDAPIVAVPAGPVEPPAP
jgi:glycosyltransferase involved in cell wall biosynthesis